MREPRSPELAKAGGILGPRFADLEVFYDRIATQVGRPMRGPAAPTAIPLPAKPDRLTSDDPEALWVGLHLEQLELHAAGLPAPAQKLARLHRTPWWRSL